MKLQLELSEASGLPVYQQLVAQLRDKILAGETTAGEMLPSVRELAAVLAVNPLTVSKAYKALEKEGLVISVQGKGTFVAENEPRHAKEALEDEVRRAVADLVSKSRGLGISEELVIELLRIEFRERRDQADVEQGESRR